MDLAQYLKERILSIDIFDGESRMHFGTCKVPLQQIMRQGRNVVSKGLDCEIFEAQHGYSVGTLQLLLTNQGYQASNPKALEEHHKRVQPNQGHSKSRFKKKVASNPINIENEGSYMNHLKTQLVSHTADDEEARKRLRIERLK